MTNTDPPSQLEQSDTATESGWCGATNWSLLRQAAHTDGPGAAEALEQLCRRYWPPVYAYIRRRGYERCQAEDLTLKGVLLRSAPGEDVGIASEGTGARSQQLHP